MAKSFYKAQFGLKGNNRDRKRAELHAEAHGTPFKPSELDHKHLELYNSQAEHNTPKFRHRAWIAAIYDGYKPEIRQADVRKQFRARCAYYIN